MSLNSFEVMTVVKPSPRKIQYFVEQAILFGMFENFSHLYSPISIMEAIEMSSLDNLYDHIYRAQVFTSLFSMRHRWEQTMLYESDTNR